MNNSFSLQQIGGTGNFDPNLISRQYKLDLMSEFMRIKFEYPKMKESEIANQIRHSSSTIQRYRNHMNMLAPYRLQPKNTNKRTKKPLKTNFEKNTHREHDFKRPQKTSNDLKSTSNETVKIKKKQIERWIYAREY